MGEGRVFFCWLHPGNRENIFQETQVNELTYDYLSEFNRLKYLELYVIAGPDGFSCCCLSSACNVRCFVKIFKDHIMGW